MTATTRRREAQDGQLLTDVQEAMELRWHNWDAFELRRLVDGEQVSMLRVADGQAWAQRGDGTWVSRGDPEPWRQELRIGWNAWNQALDPFDERVNLTPVGDDVVEGRRVRRYTVALEPEPAQPARSGKAKRKAKRRRSSKSTDELLDLTGEVVLDQGTAARLLARVEGSWRKDDRVRTISLDLSRSGIGQPQTITPPEPDLPRSGDRPSDAAPETPPGSP